MEKATIICDMSPLKSDVKDPLNDLFRDVQSNSASARYVTLELIKHIQKLEEQVKDLQRIVDFEKQFDMLIQKDITDQKMMESVMSDQYIPF